MLLAYIDEVGETGAFVSKSDPRFNTSPAFGYAGFILPHSRARAFGARFTSVKRTLFATEIANAANPGQWERKGADMLRAKTWREYPHLVRAYTGLTAELINRFGGKLFYYANEKPIGTPGQTRLDPEAREVAAMRETLNRICTFAEQRQRNVMVLMDQIDERTREKRAPNMYGHILARATEREEMRRIVEPPMHVDSALSANIQFADWIAASVSRGIEHQMLKVNYYAWVPTAWERPMTDRFTYESKLHLFDRAISDIHGHELFGSKRPLFPTNGAQTVGDSVPADVLRRIYGAAQAAKLRQSGKQL